VRRPKAALPIQFLLPFFFQIIGINRASEARPPPVANYMKKRGKKWPRKNRNGNTNQLQFHQ